MYAFDAGTGANQMVAPVPVGQFLARGGQRNGVYRIWGGQPGIYALFHWRTNKGELSFKFSGCSLVL